MQLQTNWTKLCLPPTSTELSTWLQPSLQVTWPQSRILKGSILLKQQMFGRSPLLTLFCWTNMIVVMYVTTMLRRRYKAKCPKQPKIVNWSCSKTSKNTYSISISLIDFEHDNLSVLGSFEQLWAFIFLSLP